MTQRKIVLSQKMKRHCAMEYFTLEYSSKSNLKFDKILELLIIFVTIIANEKAYFIDCFFLLNNGTIFVKK